MRKATKAAKGMASHHTEMPSESWTEVDSRLHAPMASLKPESTPAFMAAADTAYMTRAIQLPTRPSPERYQVPDAQPPARMMPMPKTSPPTTTARGAKVSACASMTPAVPSAARPTACTAMTMSRALKPRQDFWAKMSRIMPVTQKRPRCMTKPKMTPRPRPVRSMEFLQETSEGSACADLCQLLDMSR